MSTETSPEAKKITRNTTVVSLGIATSRIFGLLRDILIGSFFSAGLRDIFFLVLTIPNFSRRLFGEGALSQAFIPMFSHTYKNEGKTKGWQMTSSTINIVFLILLLLSILGMMFSPLIIKLIAPGFPESSRALAIYSLRIIFPFMIFICLQAIFMGMLNSLGHFWTPSFASTLFNVAIIAFILFFGRYSNEAHTPLLSLSLGVLLGSFLQMGVQIPPLLRRGYRHSFKIQWKSPAIRKTFQLMGPALLGVGVMQINLIVDRFLASYLPAGGISSLWYSNRLIQLPLALFGISIATATFPALASQSAKNKLKEMKKTLFSSLNLTMFATIPATIALIFLGKPLINLLFQRREFTSQDTQATYSALLFYALGLLAFAGIKVVVGAFHSLKDTKTPVKVGMVAVAINIVADLLLLRPLAGGGLALATSLASFFNFFMLFFLLRRPLGAFKLKQLLLPGGKMLVASLIMGVFLALGVNLFYKEGLALIQKILVVISIGGGGTVIYFGVAHLLGIPEMKLIRDSLCRRTSD